MGEQADKLIVMGVITGAHGIRGEVRIKSFTEAPEDIASHGPLHVNDGPKKLTIASLRPRKGVLIARIEGVNDRNAAEALKGVRLKLPRAALPEPDEDEFYYSDLEGLEVLDESGRPLGRVRAVHNFGAGDLLEIQPPSGKSFYVPFSRDNVPQVNISAGRLVARLPPDEDAERE